MSEFDHVTFGATWKKMLVWNKSDVKTTGNVPTSVQAEYKILGPPTFLDPFGLRKLMADHFFLSDIVFTYPQGPLALGS